MQAHLSAILHSPETICTRWKVNLYTLSESSEVHGLIAILQTKRLLTRKVYWVFGFLHDVYIKLRDFLYKIYEIMRTMFILTFVWQKLPHFLLMLSQEQKTCLPLLFVFTYCNNIFDSTFAILFNPGQKQKIIYYGHHVLDNVAVSFQRLPKYLSQFRQ